MLNLIPEQYMLNQGGAFKTKASSFVFKFNLLKFDQFYRKT
jgi:hypothetical protein